VPTCPNCQNQYPPEIETCPECGVSLTDTSPFSTTPDQADTELLELAKFHTMAEADLMKELLESNGVRTVVRGDADPIGGIELPTILVEHRHFEKAAELYETYFAGESVEAENVDADES
jgi:hypothetical protein